jgi:hypothetical protein
MSSIKNLKKDKKFSHSGNNIIINIEFQNGIKKQIEINSDSNCGNLAFQFCKKYNLDYKSLIKFKSILENIKKNPSNGYNKYNITININNTENNFIIFNDINPNQNNNIKNNINQIEENKSTINKNNFFNANQKLFPYEFQIIPNFKKKKIKISFNKLINSNIPNNINLINNNNKKINSSSYKNLSSIEKDLTFLNKSDRTFKQINTISNFSRIQSSKNINNKSQKSNNIFERLFNDAEIKRITYRRPCHFSSTLRNKTLKSIDNNSISSNYNSFNFTNVTMFSNSSNGNDKESNYNNSYMYRKNLINLSPISFSHNNSKINQKNYINFHKKNYSQIQNKYVKDYKPYIIKEEENNSNKKTSNKKRRIKFNTINTLNEREKKENIQKNKKIYHQFKDKKITNIQEGDLLLEGIRNEAFQNLFVQLNGNNQAQELNEKNINLEKIPSLVLYDIEPITYEIYKNKKTYSSNEFITEMKNIFNTLSMEEKRNIISLYRNPNYQIPFNNSYNINSPNCEKRKKNINHFNTKQLNYLSTYRKLNTNIVKYLNKKNNNKLNYYNTINQKSKNSSLDKFIIGNQKKRNFYYIN